MKSILVILALSMMAATGRALAEDPPDVFEHMDPALLDLQDTQQATVNSLKSRASTVEVQVIRINPPAFLSNRMRFNLNREGTARFEADTVERKERPGNKTTWRGRAEGNPDPINFFLRKEGGNNLGNGTFVKGDYLFEVRPLGKNGLHALIKIDPKKFAKDEPEEFKEVEEKAKQSRPGRTDPMADEPANGFVIKVMVLYTKQVAKIREDQGVDEFLDNLIVVSNQTFSDCGIPITLELAHHEQVDYDESGAGVAKHCARLCDKNDGILDGIHNLRNAHAADIVVLLVANADSGGYSCAINADSDHAFSVVDEYSSASNFSFVHEIGHLLGARHNEGRDSSTVPYPHGHGYINLQKDRCTIMAYRDGVSHRAGLWATPLHKHPAPSGDANDTFGTAAVNDDARVLRERASEVSNFR